ncbi:MAG: hypothetical protein HYW07_11600, partial [Candidatus Latescibacteria bacterium]|nr:hypothetical protein [Candidatus Latescibacterota bacterium]
RTPMNAILGYAQILQRAPDLGGQHRRAVETIHKSGDHLLNLINDVLDISKIEAGRMVLNPDDFDLGEMLENLGTMFELQYREKGLGWRLEGIGPERLPVHGDEAKLRQVLINLLGNAVKFTREGEVALRLDRLPGHCYGFEVRDTGPGMTEEEQEKIFQPFQQGEAGMRQGGTGLGLTISQRQLGLMGSALKVDSEVEKGSRFFFEVELPPAQSAPRAEGPQTWGQVTRLAAGFSVKALLADDVAENREILSGMLGELGVADLRMPGAAVGGGVRVWCACSGRNPGRRSGQLERGGAASSAGGSPEKGRGVLQRDPDRRTPQRDGGPGRGAKETGLTSARLAAAARYGGHCRGVGDGQP